ncbi:MAG: tetratricopeptide repeat protein [Treponema sp.]|jgi:tetratricopeptide (TPR) repeat protein|nr:tetratricopeptide repeat protein [Treponema sp.]
MAKSRIWPVIGAGALKRRGVQGFLYAVGLLAFVVLVLFFISKKNGEAGIKKREVLRNWENGSYNEVFDQSSLALKNKPLDSFFLTVNGFASYQLAISQINQKDTLSYLDSSIWSLRKILLEKNADRDGRIRYVLGKAYYEKGPEYADLAIRYLEEAGNAGYGAKDIPEYLGLAYHAVREYRKSVETLSRALDPGQSGTDSDRLLLAIARSYIGLEDWDNAKAYLTRCIEQTLDGGAGINARLLLGKVLLNSGDAAGAESVYTEVLEDTENAEAAYELGEIYAAQGDTIRARAAWRRAYRADNNYRPARVRLNM